MNTRNKGAAPATSPGDVRGRQASTARMHLYMTVALAASIVIAAIAVSMGVAGAQSVHAFPQPDTGLVLALMLAAVGVMGALSALAVRLAGRFRQR
ncbi:MAG TPA: hypothetical protein VHG27_00685 [Xanthobacteraceae bacterium]|nr:hypothetical protein [Xanthobacteraceae bacterium]